MKLTSLTSDVKQLIQRSHWEANTIEPRKITARKHRNTSKGFYIGDDPKVGCNCEGELLTVVTVSYSFVPAFVSQRCCPGVPISYQLWIAVELEHNPFFVSLTRRIKKRRVLGSALTWNCDNAILRPKKGNKHTHETNASLPRSFSESWISAPGANSSVKTEPSHCSWYYSGKAVLMATFGKKYKIKSQKVWKEYFLRKGNVYPRL